MADISYIRLSGTTYQIIDESALHNLDDTVTSGGTNAVKGSGIYNAITASTAALAESISDMHYQTSGDVQNAISGKLDTSVFETYSGNVNTALGTKFAGATWSSNDKKIYFYDNPSNTGTALAYIDGTDFVKDGFLSSVTIDNRTISGESVPCLVFIWNTDSGIQETDIPISGIFDPSNYYDKTAVDNIVSGLTARINEDEEVTAAALNNLEDGKQDTLVSGTNIKTVNNQSLLGSGDITIEAGNKVEVSGTTLVFL